MASEVLLTHRQIDHVRQDEAVVKSHTLVCYRIANSTQGAIFRGFICGQPTSTPAVWLGALAFYKSRLRGDSFEVAAILSHNISVASAAAINSEVNLTAS